ncbi:MAG: hypothetical protein Q8M32_09870 [Brevundimonas sp.]|nr:hypothetical protein [Brevundimonas sp.]
MPRKVNRKHAAPQHFREDLCDFVCGVNRFRQRSHWSFISLEQFITRIRGIFFSEIARDLPLPQFGRDKAALHLYSTENSNPAD